MHYAYLTIIRDVLKAYLNPGLFFVFNVAFISLAQSVLLFLITTPTYLMLIAARLSEDMDTTDIMIARGMMGLIMIEFFADQQQWGKFVPVHI